MIKLSYAREKNHSDWSVVGVFDNKTYTGTYSGDVHTTHTSGQTWYDSAQRTCVVGLGPLPQDRMGWMKAGGTLWNALKYHTTMNVLADSVPVDFITGLCMRNWEFSHHHTDARPVNKERCVEATIVCKAQPSEKDMACVDAMHWARRVANEPGNVIDPAAFIQELQTFEKHGIEVSFLDEEAMRVQGFGALLGVAQGSVKKPYLGILRWNGGDETEKPIVLVGKGVTFDTGGISIKPSAGMYEMKMDKTGAVVVSAVVKYLAARKAPVNVVAVVALVENMPSGTAQRPGDIVKSLSGQTIEVLDTDAEGRLILADALHYAHTQYAPRAMVDVATLTGAVRIALGPTYAGYMTHHDSMSEGLSQASILSGEKIWRLPLCEEYDRALDSDVADMQNITLGGFGAGSSIGGQFLSRFVPRDIPWAHLDIAGVDYLKNPTSLCPKGGSAFGIMLLSAWIEHSFCDGRV